MNEEISHIGRLLAWGLLAGFGGAVKYVSTVVRSTEIISHRRFLLLLGANMFISSFCGLMGAMLTSTFTQDMMWHGVAAGLFGYMGTQGLDWIMLALKRKIDPSLPISAVIPVPSSNE